MQLDDIFAVGGQVDIQPGERGTAVAQCPAGRRPVSGNHSATSLTVFGGGVSCGVLNQFTITARNDVGQTVTLLRDLAVSRRAGAFGRMPSARGEKPASTCNIAISLATSLDPDDAVPLRDELE